MPSLRQFLLSAFGSAALGGGLLAQDPGVQPASWPKFGGRSASPTVPCPTCPGGVMPAPGYPSPGYPSPAYPTYPGYPSVMPKPGDPKPPEPKPGDKVEPKPGDKKEPGKLPDPKDPNAQNQAQQNLDNALAQSQPNLGTGSEGSALPNVFGDLFGGGSLSGPLAVPVAANGQFIGVPVTFILPGGRIVTATNVAQLAQSGAIVTGSSGSVAVGGSSAAVGGGAAAAPVNPFVDEAVARLRPTVNVTTPGAVAAVGGGAVLPPGTPIAQTLSVTPPQGAVFTPNLQSLVSRIPIFNRGAFKITENDTPRPTSRAYLIYNFYDNLLANSGLPTTPRVMLHQQQFGAEYAFMDRQFSVGLRLPYNQLVAPGLFNNTSIGDLTVISKAVLWEDRQSGNLLSGGLILTLPTGARPNNSTISGGNFRDTLIQPFVGYIYTGGDAFLQGFTSVVLPTSTGNVSFLSQDLAAGYYVYRDKGGMVSALVPVFEAHLNVPFNRRGSGAEPVGLSDTLTLLIGLNSSLYDRAWTGFAVGTPVTGNRPFQLQATFNFSWQF